jgi:hypothetical protein
MASRGSPSCRKEAGSSATIPRGYDTFAPPLSGPSGPDANPRGGRSSMCVRLSAARVHAPRQRRRDAAGGWALKKPTPRWGAARRRVGTRRAGLVLADRAGQRERERERRVSDADTSYKGPFSGARALKHVIPQRKHANYNSLSLRPGPSPGQHPKRLKSIMRTDPNPVLCSPRTQAGCRNAHNIQQI